MTGFTDDEYRVFVNMRWQAAFLSHYRYQYCLKWPITGGNRIISLEDVQKLTNSMQQRLISKFLNHGEITPQSNNLYHVSLIQVSLF